jgi:hypothetical protein
MGTDGMPNGASNMFVYDASAETGKPLTTHQHYDGTQKPWEFKRIWHLEPSLTDPDTVYAGAEDAAIFKSSDGGNAHGMELPGLRAVPRAISGSPAPGVCACTPFVSGPEPAPIACTSPSLRRAPSAPTMAARPGNRSIAACKSQYELPDPDAEVGHCVHRIAMHPSRPERAVHAEALGRPSQRRLPATQWHEVSGNLPSDFGFPDRRCMPMNRIRCMWCRSRAIRNTYPPEGTPPGVSQQAPAAMNGRPSPKGLPQQDCYVNVLREAMAVDALDPCGIYFGTTGGQVYASRDGGDSWTAIVRDLPGVLSVEVQAL